MPGLDSRLASRLARRARDAPTGSAPALPKQAARLERGSSPSIVTRSAPASQEPPSLPPPPWPPGVPRERTRPSKPGRAPRASQGDPGPRGGLLGALSPGRRRQRVRRQVCGLAFYELGGPDPRCKVHRVPALPDYPKALLLPVDGWLYVIDGSDRERRVALPFSDLPGPVRGFLQDVAAAERDRRARPADYRNQYRPLAAQRLPGQRSPERSTRRSLEFLIESSGTLEDQSAT